MRASMVTATHHPASKNVAQIESLLLHEPANTQAPFHLLRKTTGWPLSDFGGFDVDRRFTREFYTVRMGYPVKNEKNSIANFSPQSIEIYA
jgi:hypothetical protein